MIEWLNRLIAWWRKPACPGAEILTHGDADFWDIGQAAEHQIEGEPGRVEYRFLGVTGEEES